ncbi:hypothetical protein GWK47_005204 [Chionoecetes opilio]|uniref:Regulatory protein zeste n=1 Tax=Chionoecetes opilio TaxID=41210 RepID=A0A8J4YJ13_CHIOP|nr:hypothetical protein GWK47_005204 [Chionoecetes opilio]
MEKLEGTGPARTSPISAAERSLLVGMIREEKVLQNRQTAGIICVRKREAWARITTAFNGQNLGPRRTEIQLKKVWDRLKIKAKQEHAVKRREERKTGGGAPPADLPEETDNVLAILGDDIKDLGNQYDDDEMAYSAKSNRHGRLIRFTQSLFVRGKTFGVIIYNLCDTL